MEFRKVTKNNLNRALTFSQGQVIVGNMHINASEGTISFEPQYNELTGRYIADKLSLLKSVGVDDSYTISVCCSGYNIEGLSEVNGHMLNSGELNLVTCNYTGSEYKIA